MKTVILGAGLTGLSCANTIGKNYAILEKTERVGGLCKTEIVNGFVFDHVIHLIHWRDPEIKQYAERLLGENKKFFQREAYIRLGGAQGKYPVQVYADAYPESVRNEFLEGLLEVQKNPQGNETANYKEWLLSKFGKGLCKHFFFPYNEKQWLRPLEDIVVSGTTRFTPPASLEEFLRATYLKQDIVVGYNPHFFYPLRGGIEVLLKKMAETVNPIHLNEGAIEVDAEKRMVRTTSGKKHSYDWLVSSMPLPKLVESIPNAPSEVAKSASKLRNVSSYNINLGVKGKPPKGHWVYFPEKKFVFFRICMGSNLTPYMAPEGHYSLWIETSFDPKNPPDFEKIKQQAIDQAIEIGYVKKESDIVETLPMKIPFSYVVFDQNHEESKKTITDYLKQRHILTGGRFGRWEYSSIEDAILEGNQMGKQVMEGKS